MRHETTLSEARHLRLAFEELGVTFIKLGQILSTRPDLLPDDYLDELGKLRDAVPPVDAVDIRAVLEAELGTSLDRCFAHFDDNPLASASIGQVHAAKLLDGTDVVVKVQKPGVPERVAEDVEVLRQLAAVAEQRSQTARRYDAEALVDEFEWQLRAELDYFREARNALRFAEQLAGNPAVLIPRIHWRYTTRMVLTMERLEGVPIHDGEGIDAAGIDRRLVAENCATILLESIFQHGFYHADPHPGNFFVQPGGAIAVVDFGMVGQISEDNRFSLVRLLDAVVHQKPDAAVDALGELGMRPRASERRTFVRDMRHMLDAYYGLDLEDISASRLYRDLTAISRRHSLPMPADLALLFKTISMNEGLERAINPSFNFLRTAEPFAREGMAELRSPLSVARRTARTTAESAILMPELPERAWRILRQAEHGEFQIRLHPEEVERAIDGLRAVLNRLAASIIGAAVTVAVAIVMLANRPPAWRIASGFFLASGPLVVGSLWSWALWSARRRE